MDDSYEKKRRLEQQGGSDRYNNRGPPNDSRQYPRGGGYNDRHHDRYDNRGIGHIDDRYHSNGGRFPPPIIPPQYHPMYQHPPPPHYAHPHYQPPPYQQHIPLQPPHQQQPSVITPPPVISKPRKSRFDLVPDTISQQQTPPQQQVPPQQQPIQFVQSPTPTMTQKLATEPIQFQTSPQQEAIDQEKLKQEREEEKIKEQDKLEEEMKKRREKVEQWRKQKLEEELKKTGESSTTAATTTNTSSITATAPITTTTSPTSNKKEWNLEEEEEVVQPLVNTNIEKKEIKLPPTSTIASQQQPIPPQEEEDDEIDPLDAFMDNLNKESGKEKSKKTATMIQEDKLEEESEGEGDEEGKDKTIKKGKREMLYTDHANTNYQSFQKNFYIEVPVLANMSDTEVLDYRSELGLKITGKDCPKPIQSWAQAGLTEKVHLLLKKFQYEKPTPIQAQTIPAIMSGRDLIGIARTGSGKTLAFLLPMFRHILAQPKSAPGEGMIALIMSPTRELALQIHVECKKFSKILGLRTACVYGGASISEQIAELKRGADIVVCTPGRMIDILCANNKRITNLRRVTFLVLDEADRMFDMGFGPQINCIVDNIRPDRQTIMFSATFPPKVENVAKKILNKPLEIIAGGRSIVSSDIEQHVEVRPSETRFRRLIELLSIWYHKGQILIFTNRQETTDNLYRQLSNSQYQCLSLHGRKDQTDRDETISDFKNKVKTILIATPLASRGLDIKDLNLVVNFDCPDHLEDYVHRVGRTGRAGNRGTSYTFITPEEERFSSSIIKALEQSGSKIPEELKKLNDNYEKKKKEGKDVLLAPTGFTGRGHKFDAAEEDKKNIERKQQRKAYGIEEEEEDEEEDEEKLAAEKEKKKLLAAEKEKLDASTAATSAVTVPTSTTSTSTISPTTLLQTDPSVPVGQQAINQIFGVQTITSSEEAIKAVQLAAQLGMGLKTNNHPKQNPAIPLNQTHFVEELEINDYSQQARWKVTHKDALLEITNFTNTTITTKGTFFPPNKTPGPGERKLYLYIEGPSDSSVKNAKSDIKKILDEVQSTHQSTGKYSVF